ncbi:hypothetical protein AYK26_02145 [Euryarchaeota archaeon SM23-78]|nr:MAG: hypothetical protein AYK26_02145 [Euryarchaeota archaeon SM23-78]MBW3000351.1 hypothetical protein [Candidatus Woesearchaeota archaeon]
MWNYKNEKKYSVVCLFARELGFHTLKDTIEDNFFEVKAVITHYYEPNLKTKRKLFDKYVTFCEEKSIPLVVVNKNQSNLRILKEIKFDFLIANCYKYIIPDEFLDLAKIGSYNMHRSLLPKYKGLKPIKKALENKEKETGTTFHRMTGVVDSGEIIDQYKVPIERGDTEKEIFEKLYPTQYVLMKRALLKIIKGK